MKKKYPKKIEKWITKFTDMAYYSKDDRDFINKARKIKNVPAEVSDWFAHEYDDPDMYKAAEDFMQDVSDGLYENRETLKSIISEIKYTPNYISKDNTNNYYFQRNSKAIGAFGTVQHNSDYEILKLNSYDKKFVKDVKLKSGQEIFRFETETSKIGKLTPLIILNIAKGLVYFLVAEPMEGETDAPVFETRGIKLRYLHIKENY